MASLIPTPRNSCTTLQMQNDTSFETIGHEHCQPWGWSLGLRLRLEDDEAGVFGLKVLSRNRVCMRRLVGYKCHSESPQSSSNSVLDELSAFLIPVFAQRTVRPHYPRL